MSVSEDEAQDQRGHRWTEWDRRRELDEIRMQRLARQTSATLGLWLPARRAGSEPELLALETMKRNARTARLAKVRKFLYKLLRGAHWASGEPLRELRRKLALLPIPVTVTQVRRAGGRIRRAKAEQRHMWDWVGLWTNMWATDRRMTGASRGLAVKARRRYFQKKKQKIAAGGVMRRHRGKQTIRAPKPEKEEEPPPPFPAPIRPCRFCGKAQDSFQHFWTESEGFQIPCEVWTSEMWLATGQEWHLAEHGDFWKEVLCLQNRPPHVTKDIVVTLSSLRRRHRYVRQNQDTFGMRCEAELPDAKKLQWRLTARALTLNPTMTPRISGIKAVRKGVFAKMRRAKIAKVRAAAARQAEAARRPAQIHFASGLGEWRGWVTEQVEGVMLSHGSLSIPFAKENQAGLFLAGTQAELTSARNHLIRSIPDKEIAES